MGFRGNQPLGSTRINRGSALAQHLIHAFVARSSPDMHCRITGEKSAQKWGGWPPVNSPYGYGVDLTDSTYFCTLKGDGKFWNTSQGTIVLGFLAKEAWAGVKCITGIQSSSGMWLEMNANNDFYFYMPGGYCYASAGVANGDYFQLTITWNVSKNLMNVYKNGVKVSYETNGTISAPTPDYWYVGWPNYCPKSLLFYAYAYNRELSPTTIAQLANDPYGMFVDNDPLSPIMPMVDSQGFTRAVGAAIVAAISSVTRLAGLTKTASAAVAAAIGSAGRVYNSLRTASAAVVTASGTPARLADLLRSASAAVVTATGIPARLTELARTAGAAIIAASGVPDAVKNMGQLARDAAAAVVVAISSCTPLQALGRTASAAFVAASGVPARAGEFARTCAISIVPAINQLTRLAGLTKTAGAGVVAAISEVVGTLTQNVRTAAAAFVVAVGNPTRAQALGRAVNAAMVVASGIPTLASALGRSVTIAIVAAVGTLNHVKEVASTVVKRTKSYISTFWKFH